MHRISDTRIWPLPDIQATQALGKALAQAVRNTRPGALLMYGDLGAGKTTLTRFLVEALPGGEDAEIASPSFTICNIYCTQPLVHHYDLYRLEPGMRDESLDESLDNAAILTIIEWPDRLSPADMPDDGIVCILTRTEDRSERHAELASLGPRGAACLIHMDAT